MLLQSVAKCVGLVVFAVFVVFPAFVFAVCPPLSLDVPLEAAVYYSPTRIGMCCCLCCCVACLLIVEVVE